MFSFKKRKLSFRKHKRSSSSNSVSDAEDRVIMVCEEIPSEYSADSGRGSQSPETRSSQESSVCDADTGLGWSTGSLSRNHSLRIEDRTSSVSAPNAGDHYAVRSTLHVKELYRSDLLNPPLISLSTVITVMF